MFKAFVLSAMLIPLPAFAEDLMVTEAWMPVAPPTATVHAAYVTLQNSGSAPRVLTGVSAVGYGMSHLHESKETDGVGTMSMLHQIEIPAGGLLTMRPGRLHVMLMGPDLPITEGDNILLTLTFANGESLHVDAIVKARDAES